MYYNLGLQFDKFIFICRYFNESIEEHALSNTESYDAIVTSEVLEHVSNKYGFLTKCIDCLKVILNYFCVLT